MNPLIGALAVSLLIHFSVIAGVEMGRTMGWWSHSLLPKSLQPKLAEVVKDLAEQRKAQAEQEREREIPLLFVEVDPSQAVPEPPKEATHYSSQSTRASNPTPADQAIPMIDGSQDKVQRTADVKRFESMQPAPPPPQETTPTPTAAQPPKPQPKAPPQEAQPERKEGDMLMAKAQPRREEVKPDNETPPAQKPRPRRLAEARAQKGLIEGQKMKQEGGVRRNALLSNLDVRATPFGAYDAQFIAAVQARWYSILDERDFVGSQSGKVVVDFKLHQDGRITEIRVADSQVSETLGWICQRAILDNADYPPFPADMRRLLGKDFREVRFTFFYNN